MPRQVDRLINIKCDTENSGSARICWADEKGHCKNSLTNQKLSFVRQEISQDSNDLISENFHYFFRSGGT